MNFLPNDIIRYCISEGYLNPTERSNLAACNKYLYSTLPQPLRIKIVSSSSSSSSTGFGFGNSNKSKRQQIHQQQTHRHHTLQTEFFVSNVETPTKYILGSENLIYGQSYLFWTFDYQRNSRVYLGRHTRHGGRGSSSSSSGQSSFDENGLPITTRNNSIYTLGLRPREPNQVWEIMGGSKGDFVMWGEDIQLQVYGTNIKPRQPDSITPSILSCQQQPKPPRRSHHSITTTTTTQSVDVKWCCINNNNNVAATTTFDNNQRNNHNHNNNSTKMQLIRCDDYILKPTNFTTTSKPLQVYAIPDASDEGEYLLINPDSYKDGSVVGCEGDHVIVDFHYWIEKGIMYLKASSLEFGLGIPILETDFINNNNELSSSMMEEDNDNDNNNTNTATTRRRLLSSHPTKKNMKKNVNPLSNLLDIRSARWGCVIYYMAVGADSKEGVNPDMTRFVNCVTDHSDHTVEYKQDEEMVYVKVKNKKVIDPRTVAKLQLPTTMLSPPHQQKKKVMEDGIDDEDSLTSCLWKFILSW